MLSKNPRTNLIGMANSLPRPTSLSAIQSLFIARFPIHGFPVSVLKEVLTQIDHSNHIAPSHSKYMPCIEALMDGITVGTLVHTYNSTTQQTLAEIKKCARVADGGSNYYNNSTNTGYDDAVIGNLHRDQKEPFLLRFVQGLLHAPIHSYLEFSVYE